MTQNRENRFQTDHLHENSKKGPAVYLRLQSELIVQLWTISRGHVWLVIHLLFSLQKFPN